MAEETSQAAVAAIAALQRRLRDLENEKMALENEFNQLSTQTKRSTSSYLAREDELSDATNKASKIIDLVADAASKITEEREQNSKMKRKLVEIELLLSQKPTKTPKKKDLYSYSALLKEYESILAEFLVLPAVPVRPIGKISTDIDLLPKELRIIAKRLKELPFDYKHQSIQTKIAIIQGFICTFEALQGLSDEILSLSASISNSQSPRLNKIDMKQKIAYFVTLRKELERFEFD